MRPRKVYPPVDASFEDVLTAIADENMPAIEAAEARPFLKWAGGKRSVLHELIPRMPAEYDAYCEPFLGGAALFFAVQPKKAYLSDLNFHLVLTYIAVRDDAERLITNLKNHEARHSDLKQREEFYLKARTRIAKEEDATKIGALLIYLNKTCYNGLYRVNRTGAFNVPMGSYVQPTIVDEKNLRSCAKALKGVQIMHHPFQQTPIRKGTFYYLDPPYHKTFSSFDSSGFDDGDHEKLAKFCRELDAAGCSFMVSNSNTPLIKKLYDGFTIEAIKAGRFISCKGEQRVKETELLIRNYSTFQRKEGAENGQSSGEVR